MSNYTFKFAQLDPRNTSTAQDTNNSVLGNEKKAFGIEVTVRALAERCSHNLDHHGLGTTVDTPSAVEQALTCTLPEAGTTLVTVRTDADSLSAMAVLEARARGLAIDEDIVKAIGLVDRKGPQAGVEQYKALTIAVARIAADFKVSLENRVSWIMNAITGKADETEVVALNAARDKEFEAAKAASKVSLAGNGRVAVVVSGHRFATNLGYEVADIVIAYNEAMPVDFKDPSKGTYVKFTLCIRDEHVPYDIKAAVSHLNDIEGSRREDGLRWGGSATIAGSPQGVSSMLSLEEVIGVVESHLK